MILPSEKTNKQTKHKHEFVQVQVCNLTYSQTQQNNVVHILKSTNLSTVSRYIDNT